MLSKSDTIRLIEDWAPKIISNLKLEHMSIEWHVVKSPPKETCFAKTFFENDRSRLYRIAIYYNKHSNEKETIGSIVHELLHVRMRSYSRLIKKSQLKNADTAEENIVQALEALYLDLL